VREAIHTVFLFHAIRAGMTMGIVNAGMIGVYDDLDPELKERVEDVVPSKARRRCQRFRLWRAHWPRHTDCRLAGGRVP